MHCIQCFPLYKPDVIRRLISRAAGQGAEILLDLEDGVSNVTSPILNAAAKAEARVALLLLTEFLQALQGKTKLHIRVNSPSSNHFEQDLEILARLKGISWHSIFLPKVESESDVSGVQDLFKSRPISYKYISPIIETKKGYSLAMRYGLSNLQQVETLFFGNYDYNVSYNTWPVIDQNNRQYFDVVEPLFNAANQMGLLFGNSPYAKLGDLYTLKRVINFLWQKCGGHFSQVTLNAAQTKLCLTFKGGEVNNAAAPVNFYTATDYAHIGGDFVMYKSAGRGFAYNAKKELMVTPHEYLLSLRNLSH